VAKVALGVAAALTAACGVLHKDVEIAQEFVAGGGPPTATASIAASSITAPLAASAGELSKLSSVTLQSARLSSTDGGDLSYVGGATIKLSGNGLPEVTLAQLAAPPGAKAEAALSLDSARDLKPYLAAGGLLAAEVTYAVRPVSARGLKLTLVVRASL